MQQVKICLLKGPFVCSASTRAVAARKSDDQDTCGLDCFVKKDASKKVEKFRISLAWIPPRSKRRVAAPAEERPTRPTSTTTTGYQVYRSDSQDRFLSEKKNQTGCRKNGVCICPYRPNYLRTCLSVHKIYACPYFGTAVIYGEKKLYAFAFFPSIKYSCPRK